jgi:phosphatidylglycerol:prolipoprotein diacylglycerol transferase
MHPILFRVPLPNRPLFLWWALAVVAVIAAGYALVELRRRPIEAAIPGAVVLGASFLAWLLRDMSWQATNLPIYSYGVMLGLSLVVGWYLTLTLCDRDGLPKEAMANCYVVTALVAIIGSRVLYVATNPDEFSTWKDWFAMRRGGLVAYGGFLGGFLGSWAFLQRHKIRLVAWADDVVPSLASGLFVTRIGCYLFGCDFGKRLPETAPAFLKTMGTFPRWAQSTMDAGEGSPAYVRHLEMFRGTPTGDELVKAGKSLPVHPTQIYESAVGLGLLLLLLLSRRSTRFRGQQFLTFVYAYGVLRFILEMLRDDVERGEYGPVMSEHVLVPSVLALLGVGFVFGLSLAIRSSAARTVARVLSFVPAVASYVLLAPPSFGQSRSIQLSTSQWIAFVTAMLASFFYAHYWQDANRNPRSAMALGEGASEGAGKTKSGPDDGTPNDDEEGADEDAAERPGEPETAKGA